MSNVSPFLLSLIFQFFFNNGMKESSSKRSVQRVLLNSTKREHFEEQLEVNFVLILVNTNFNFVYSLKKFIHTMILIF